MKAKYDIIIYEMERDKANIETEIRCIRNMNEVLQVTSDQDKFNRVFQNIIDITANCPDNFDLTYSCLELFQNLIHFPGKTQFFIN